MVEQYNIAIGKSERSNEMPPRKNSKFSKISMTKPFGMKCTTVYEFLIEAFSRNGNNKAVGWRDIIDIHEEKKLVDKIVNGKNVPTEKTWLYYEVSPYKYNTYEEMITIMHDLGRGLVQMGMAPGNVDKLHIFASTSHKWMKMFQGAQSQAIPVVTAYDTLSESGLIHSMVQTDTRAVFTDSMLLPRLIAPLKETTSIKYVIYSDTLNPNDKRQNGKMYKIPSDAIQEIKKCRPDIKFFSYDEILKMGQKAKGKLEIMKPKPEDLSCIMYTSGSTGDPKGVTLLHSTIVAGIGGVGSTIYQYMGASDRVIAFLPLAHIFEMVLELQAFYWGSVIGYGTVKTLSSNSMRNCLGDLQEFKPTFMVGVAAVWETIRKGIITQLANQPSFVQKIFWTAYRTKLIMERYHIPGSDAIGRTIFKKVREATGGCLRYIGNGGSAISQETQVFLSNVVAPMLIGYGLTETVANAALTQPDRFEYGVAGDLVATVTAMLVDVEELGYYGRNNQGELWLKGACVMKGYYNNPEETAKALTSDGWFKTGDIAEWIPNGHIKIIDRKKNLVKNINGEYLALEKLESVYRSSKYINNICCYVDQSKVKAVGIAVPVFPELTKLALSLGIMKPGEDVEGYLENPRLVKTVLADILKVGLNQGLGKMELLEGVVLFPMEWTPENGYVTSVQKLKREDILNAVRERVDNVYLVH